MSGNEAERDEDRPRRGLPESYAVGMDIAGKVRHVTVDAEDALIAALKAKHEFPQAAITYVRKANLRADRRHPHPDLAEVEAEPER